MVYWNCQMLPSPAIRQRELVEPGYGPTTRFTSNGGTRMEGLIPEAYAPFAQPIFAAFA